MEDIQKTLKALTHEPGVYLYSDRSDTIIYVGKAKDLARRVKQYFQKKPVGEKTARLVSEIARIEVIPVSSEFDALLLEAKLIRQHLPKYNVISRDDKSPVYVALTLSEDLPHILFLRKGQIPQIIKNRNNIVYGPFQSKHALQVLLRQMRRVTPYCTQNERTGTPCFYTHLGLCTPCPSVIFRLIDPIRRKRETAQYRKNIYHLKALFDGKTKYVRSQYETIMQHAAKSLQFELAAEYKKRLDTLYSIAQFRYDPAIFLEGGVEDVYAGELEELMAYLKNYYPNVTHLARIECFDMSQLFGTCAVGSMVVLNNGRPNFGQYRRFKIQAKGTVSDTGMMREVITRRLKHTEWPDPQFVLIDGGKTQLSVVRHILPFPYAGLAKRQEELILPYGNTYKTVHLPLSGKAIKVLQRVRDEAHRFAISYHRLLRDRKLGTILGS